MVVDVVRVAVLVMHVRAHNVRVVLVENHIELICVKVVNYPAVDSLVLQMFQLMLIFLRKLVTAQVTRWHTSTGV